MTPPRPASVESPAGFDWNRWPTSVEYAHFLRNALDDVPRKVDDDCLQELRWIYDRRNWLEAHRCLNMDFLREMKKEALRQAA